MSPANNIINNNVLIIKLLLRYISLSFSSNSLLTFSIGENLNIIRQDNKYIIHTTELLTFKASSITVTKYVPRNTILHTNGVLA